MNIVPFQFDSITIRALEIDGEPWFVGKDIAEALGYVDSTNALKQHCRGVVNRHPITDGLGRIQEARIISEADLWRLVARSQLPEAQRIERWIFEEVLPAIRRTGSYAYKKPAQSSQVRDLLMVAKAVGRVKGVDEGLAMAFGLDLIERTTGLQVTDLRRALPTVKPAEQATLNATQAGDPAGLKPRAVNAMLASLGLIQKDDNDAWVLTEAGMAHGEAKPYHRNGHSGYEVRWRPSVVEVLRSHMSATESAA